MNCGIVRLYLVLLSIGWPQLHAVSADDDIVVGTLPSTPSTGRKEDITGDLLERRNAEYRSLLEPQLMAKIAAVDAECQLSADQVRKLQLAGRGDIHRFIGVHARLERELPSLPEQGIPERERRSMFQAWTIASIRQPFGENSLFSKVLSKTLTDEQRTRYEAMNKADKLAHIRRALTNCYLPPRRLSEDQQQSLAVLIHSRYPRWEPEQCGDLTSQVVMVIVSELREEVQPLLNAEQWRLTQSYIIAALGTEPTIREHGLWPISPVNNR